MKAAVCTKYGNPEVIEIKNIEKPKPKGNEVLVKVFASSVTTADCMMRTGKPYFGRLFMGLKKPKKPITGTGFSGVVEAVGKEVKSFKKGDQVFGETALEFGANAEYICIREDGIISIKPNQISFEEAAPMCDGALTSMNFLKVLAKIQPGQKVLINGASGSLGTAAIQIAKYFKAHVTGVCSTKNMELVKSLGADEVIDYTQKDFTKSTKRYDVVYDTIGKSSFSKCKKILSEKGTYLSPVLKIGLLLQMMWTSQFSRKKVKFSATGLQPPRELKGLLEEIKETINKGVFRSVLDKTFALEEIVNAHQFVETGHKRGNVVISIKHSFIHN